MKKILIVFVFSLFLLNPQVLFAAASTTSAQPYKEIDYTLAYPGLLPDSPLYFLKAARDRITEVLISDPLKKADFYLLQADKRLNEGIFLFKQGEGKYSLGESRISKGENYFEKALGQTIQAKKQGEAVRAITQKLYQSSLKHEQMIKILEDKTKGDLKQKLRVQGKRVKDFQKRVKEIKL